MTEGEKIKAVRKALGLTQEVFGEPFGITKGHISDVEKNKKNLSTAALELLKVRFAVSKEWWETGHGEMFDNKFRQFASYRSTQAVAELAEKYPHLQPVRQIPVLGHISAGFPNIAKEEIIGYISPPDAPSGGYALIVRGSSMEPHIKDGDYVIFIENGDYWAGDVLVVLDEWGEATLKRLREKEGERYLVPDNPTYPTMKPNEHYRIIGKVVKVWRDVHF